MDFKQKQFKVSKEYRSRQGLSIHISADSSCHIQVEESLSTGNINNSISDAHTGAEAFLRVRSITSPVLGLVLQTLPGWFP